MFDAALRHDIQARAVDLIRAHLPSLKRQGRSWVGLCPFHDDSTPSFVLSPENGLFYCHGCQAGGDVLTFLMRLKRLTFPEALTEAARSLGLPLPQRNSENARTATLAGTAETAATLFTHWLWSDAGKPGRTYLKKRGLTEETVRAFRVGFHPGHPTLLLTALTQRDIDPETARHLGLLARKHERWIGLMRGRLVFPICDRQGTVRGFGARKLSGPGPKYLNSPESGLFHKGRLLYGLPQAASAIQEHHTAVVVEGYVDVLTLHQAGFRYVVSPMATALTPEHLAVVRQLTERVTLLFDGDAAGQRAPLSALSPAADTGLIAHVVRLPEGEDPDSYLGRYGPAALHELMAAAVPLTTYILDTLLARGDPARAARDAVPLASQVHEPTLAQDVNTPAVPELVLVHVRSDTGVDFGGLFLQGRQLHFNIEMPAVTNNRAVLHLDKMLPADNTGVACDGNKDIADGSRFCQGHDVEAVHGRFQGANRIDLGHNHARTQAPRPQGDSLAAPPVPAHHVFPPGQEQVGGPDNAV